MVVFHWEGIAGEVVPVEAAEKPAALPKERLAWLDEPGAASAPEIRLLPRYDAALLGYASRELAVDARYEGRVHPGGGIIQAVILFDGRAAGTWELKHRKGDLELMIQPFEEFTEAIKGRIEIEARHIGRFYQAEITIR